MLPDSIVLCHLKRKGWVGVYVGYVHHVQSLYGSKIHYLKVSCHFHYRGWHENCYPISVFFKLSGKKSIFSAIGCNSSKLCRGQNNLNCPRLSKKITPGSFGRLSLILITYFLIGGLKVQYKCSETRKRITNNTNVTVSSQYSTPLYGQTFDSPPDSLITIQLIKPSTLP